MRSLIARLTGHASTVAASVVDQLSLDDFRHGKVIGVSQLNEMLLALAYETVSEGSLHLSSAAVCRLTRSHSRLVLSDSRSSACRRRRLSV